MGKKKHVSGLLVTIVALAVLMPAAACFAQPVESAAGNNYDIIVLTPGHSRTIYYELSDTILNNGSAFQATFIFTLGAGTLTVGIGNHSAISAGSEIIYTTAGLVGTTPVFQYAYSSSPISLTIPVGNVGVGVLFTSMLYTVGNPNFPVTMSMIFSLN